MEKVIVTGANGFIGRALCRKLSEKGIDVTALIKKGGDARELKSIPEINIVECDMSEYEHLQEILKRRGFDVMYHLAWTGSSGDLRADYNVQIDNIRCTCNLIKACEEMECHKFVFATSVMEYEIQKLMNTSKKVDIHTLYSSAKLSADYMLRALAGTTNIEYISAIISNVYGPGENSPRLINSNLRKLLQGEHCSFSSGEQLYDFIYIDDAVRILISIGKSGQPNKHYYVGSLKPRPLKDFLCEMRNQVNPEIQLGLGDFSFTGVSLSYDEFDIEAVKNDTGCVAKVAFSEGIKNMISWLREDGNE